MRRMARIGLAGLYLLALIATGQLGHAAPLMSWLRPADPELHGIEAGQFLFISDFDFPHVAESAAELQALSQRLANELGLPEIDGQVRVYIFQTHRVFSAYVRKHIPELGWFDTHRHALFLLRNGKPYIFAADHPKLRESLRHEFTHAFLNSAIRDMPIWLDEGLAVYYQAYDEAGEKRNLDLLHKWVRRGTPDLHRLEKLQTMQQMGAREYAEAWSWMHALLQGPPELQNCVRQHLAELHVGSHSTSFAERVEQATSNPAALWREHFHKP